MEDVRVRWPVEAALVATATAAAVLLDFPFGAAAFVVVGAIVAAVTLEWGARTRVARPRWPMSPRVRRRRRIGMTIYFGAFAVQVAGDWTWRPLSLAAFVLVPVAIGVLLTAKRPDRRR